MTKNIPNFARYMQIIDETNRDKCRICKHSIFDHATCPRKGKKPCLWVKNLDRPKFDCKCKNFITNDNLEYLEQEYQKRGKEDGTRKV